MKITLKVLIIGGGCAGWLVALKLVQRGISCMIVDTNPGCAYASTRNQGWLHSGAYYAIHDDIVVAQACGSGYHYIEHFYPDTIHEQTRCYFLFKSQ